MKLPLSWLKTYLPNLPPISTLDDVLAMHGLEVEAIIDHRGKFDKVVVGEIVALRPHPNADKLCLVDVRITPKGELREIVCGASNIAVGQKVPVALLGAKLPNGLTIEKRAIRGVESNGMLCAEDELGLGKSHSGIFVLDPELKVGTPLAEALELDEPVLDLALPANRSDLMSVRGLAWEITAMLGKSAKMPAPKFPTGAESSNITVTIVDTKLCSTYTAQVIRGVTVQASPAWLQNRLRAAGMRSINAIVDATNYSMLEYGQPLHAFDAAKVHGGITVRAAKVGESLVTLDGVTRKLDPSMTVIADTQGPIALAGVMGGQNSEVGETTTEIILESAIFHPVNVRKTSRQLGLVSEASKRFEKGLWPSLTTQAGAAAAALIAELGGGTVAKPVTVGAGQPKATTVQMNPSVIADRLGMAVTPAKAKTILHRLGFTVQGTTKTWTVTVPEWRPDVALPEDMIDEVGRMVGYEQVPKKLPAGELTAKDLPSAIRFQEEVKDILVDLGFTEVISHAFYGEKNARIIKGRHFAVANPLDATQQMLRKSLLPQMSEVLKKQADAGHDAAIFEIGLVFDPERRGLVDQQQYRKLALGLAHKGETVLADAQAALQKKLGTNIAPDGRTVDGPIRGRIIEFCEFDLDKLISTANIVFGDWDPNRHSTGKTTVRQLSKYPAMVRDVSFWWAGGQQALSTLLAAVQAKNPLIWEIQIKDQFTKDDKTSYLISFVYQSRDRTLTKTEVDQVEAGIKTALQKQGAEIR